jgi:hypothetical protein
MKGPFEDREVVNLISFVFVGRWGMVGTGSSSWDKMFSLNGEISFPRSLSALLGQDVPPVLTIISNSNPADHWVRVPFGSVGQFPTVVVAV